MNRTFFSKQVASKTSEFPTLPEAGNEGCGQNSTTSFSVFLPYFILRFSSGVALALRARCPWVRSSTQTAKPNRRRRRLPPGHLPRSVQFGWVGFGLALAPPVLLFSGQRYEGEVNGGQLKVGDSWRRCRRILHDDILLRWTCVARFPDGKI